jgi:hypothetical protein
MSAAERSKALTYVFREREKGFGWLLGVLCQKLGHVPSQSGNALSRVFS